MLTFVRGAKRDRPHRFSVTRNPFPLALALTTFGALGASVLSCGKGTEAPAPTPVAAGNDVFPTTTLSECFSSEFISSLKLTQNEFLALGRADLSDNNEGFGMSPLAIRMCRSANGVSEKHGEVSRQLWLKMFPDLADAGAVPITSVTNGVHAPTWIAPVFQDLFDTRIGADWHSIVRDPDRWAAAAARLSDSDIWTAHRTLKSLLIAFIRERTKTKDTGSKDTINEHEDTRQLFSPDILTIGFDTRNDTPDRMRAFARARGSP